MKKTDDFCCRSLPGIFANKLLFCPPQVAELFSLALVSEGGNVFTFPVQNIESNVINKLSFTMQKSR